MAQRTIIEASPAADNEVMPSPRTVVNVDEKVPDEEKVEVIDRTQNQENEEEKTQEEEKTEEQEEQKTQREIIEEPTDDQISNNEAQQSPRKII